MLRIATGEIFEPKYQEGAETGKPYRFHLHYLTPDERESAYRFVVPVKVNKRETRVKTDSRELFTLGVTKIENYAIEVEGKEVKVEDAETFLAYPNPEELYQEVAMRVREMTGIDVKN